MNQDTEPSSPVAIVGLAVNLLSCFYAPFRAGNLYIETALREVLEEIGLEIQIEGVDNVVSNHLDDFHHTVVIVLISDALGGHQWPGDDLTELKWINENMHIGTSYAFEADKRIIDCYFAGNMKILPIDDRIENA